jgi:hypothetical protein
VVHAAVKQAKTQTSEASRYSSWIAGSSPAMTKWKPVHFPSLVTTGLDPVLDADGWCGKPRQRTISSQRSRQSGFIEQIRSIFHLRDQCLMFFSR